MNNMYDKILQHNLEGYAAEKIEKSNRLYSAQEAAERRDFLRAEIVYLERLMRDITKILYSKHSIVTLHREMVGKREFQNKLKEIYALAQENIGLLKKELMKEGTHPKWVEILINESFISLTGTEKPYYWKRSNALFFDLHDSHLKTLFSLKDFCQLFDNINYKSITNDPNKNTTRLPKYIKEKLDMLY